MVEMMRLAGAGSKALSYFLGLVVLAMAVAVIATAKPAGSIIAWALSVFGITFTVLIAGVRLHDAGEDIAFWGQLGMHAANGIATLALTYTLLGISLGIGSLAEQTLTPETIQEVIRGLTKHFSMAFMTTVIGLPLAAFARALIALTIAARRQPQHR